MLKIFVLSKELIQKIEGFVFLFSSWEIFLVWLSRERYKTREGGAVGEACKDFFTVCVVVLVLGPVENTAAT